MSRIAPVDPESATGETKELFDAAKKKMGGVPNILRVMGNSPVALKAYLSLSDIVSKSGFSAAEREGIALAAAGSNNCDYCASAHTAISKSLEVSDDEISSRLKGQSTDARLQAAMTLSKQIIDNKGWIEDADLQAARDAGLDDGELVEIITITVLNILTNYVNHIAETEIDFPKVKASG